MEGEWDKRLEPAGFILQRSKFEQVIDPVFVAFNVAVKHGCVRFQSYLVRDLCRVEPLIAIDLVIADDVPDAIGKNLSAPAGKRIHSSRFQLYQGFANRKFRALR